MLGKKLVILNCLLVGLLACGKEGIDIGRQDPDKQIQKCLRYSEKRNFEKAIECLEIFKSRFAHTALGQQAEIKIADNYFRKREYLIAADTYQSFIRLHPFHPMVAYASYRTGLSYSKASPKAIDRDQQYLDEAIEHLEFTIRNFPESAHAQPAEEVLRVVREQVAERILYIGRFYYKTGEYRAAIPRFQQIDLHYLDLPQHVKALYYLSLSYLELGEFSQAGSTLRQLHAFYPEHRLTRKAARKVED